MKNIILLLCVFSAALVYAEVKLPSIISHRAVLARRADVPIWGTASPGEKVTVEFNGQKVSTSAGKDGKWKVSLDLKNSPEGPFVLRVNDIVVKDILVGEVWLGSGQSNMAMVMRNSAGFEQEKKGMPNTKLRMFVVRPGYKDTPQDNWPGVWRIADAKMLGSFSAASYHFGKKIQKELNTPVGLIKSAQGASFIECWMSKENFSRFPSAVARHERRMKAKKQPPWWRKAFGLYNAMIYPLIPYRLSGVIWYQGEANSKNYEDYDKLFRALITQWRKDFADPQLPFFWCNLASYRNKSADLEVTPWAQLRLKQTSVLDMPYTGEVILTDAGEALDIHPRNKKIPGDRLAALALARVYGKNVPCTGPFAVKAHCEKNAAVISFKDIYDGLEARPVPETQIIKSKENKTAPVKRNSPGTQLEGFALCGKDGKWFWADKAVIRGKQVVVSSVKVKVPVKVRCGLQNNPTCNLYNKAGFPVVPFEISVK